MDERMGKREEGWWKDDGRKERREEEGRQGRGWRRKRGRGEGELGEQGGKEGTAPTGSGSAAPAARPSAHLRTPLK